MKYHVVHKRRARRLHHRRRPVTTTNTAPEADPLVQIEFGLWWPASDPDRLRGLAAAWEAMAFALDAAAEDLADHRATVTSTNQGAAVDAFAGFVDGWTTGHLPEAAAHCRELATACRDFASAVDEARDTIRRLAIEITASIAIGAGLAILTAGISAGAAATVTAAAVTRAGIVATSLAARVIAILSRVVTFAGVGALEAGATNLVIQTGRNAATNQNHDPFAGYDLDELTISTAGGAVFGAGLGTLRSIPLTRGLEPAVDATRLPGGVSGLPRTGSGLKPDLHHDFPVLIDTTSGNGRRFLIPHRRPGGGISAMPDELIQANGRLNAQDGIYEWIVRNGSVVHRRFIPRGVINGVPNQRPPRLHGGR